MTLLLAPLVFVLGAQNANPPIPTTTRYPKLYEADSSTIAERLAQKLENAPNRDVLRWAVQQLGLMGDEAVPALRRVFYRNFSRHDNYPALSNLCEALGQTRSQKAFPVLVDALTHSSAIVRSKAVDAIVLLNDPQAFPYLRSLLSTEAKENLLPLIKAMAKTGSEEFPELANQLFKIESDLIRELILTHLSEKYAKASQALLEEQFQNPTPGQRNYKLLSAIGLAYLGKQAALDYLVEFAKDSTKPWPDRATAFQGLGKAGQIEAILAFLNHENDNLRLSLVKAFSLALARNEISADLKEQAIGGLKKLMSDRNGAVRKEAVKQLVLRGDRAALDPYLAALRTELDPDRLREILDLIIDPEICEPRAVPILVERLPKESEGIRRQLMQGLGALHDVRGVEPILKLLKEPVGDAEDKTRDQYLALQLGFLGAPAVEPLIETAKSSKDTRVRFWVLQALAWTKEIQAGDFLVDRLEDLQETRETRALLIQQIPSFAKLSHASRLKRALYRETDAQLREKLNEILWDYF